MEPHPLRGLHRWLVLPSACAASAILAHFLSRWEVGDVKNAAIFAFLSAAAGLGTAVSGRLWLNVLLSLAFGTLTSIPFVVEIVWSQEWDQNRGEVALMLFQFFVPFLVPLTTLLTAWQTRRLRRRHLTAIDLSLAAATGLAAMWVVGWMLLGNKLPLTRHSVFGVAYFVGGMLALEATLRISARKANASRR